MRVLARATLSFVSRIPPVHRESSAPLVGLLRCSYKSQELALVSDFSCSQPPLVVFFRLHDGANRSINSFISTICRQKRLTIFRNASVYTPFISYSKTSYVRAYRVRKIALFGGSYSSISKCCCTICIADVASFGLITCCVTRFHSL